MSHRNEPDPEAAAEDAPRWRRRSDARPGEIVAAALDLFVEKGFAAARMEEIARRAGVTKGTVYLYFPSKEDLFRAVVHDAILPNLEEAERMVAEHTGPTGELLRHVVHAWWERIGETRLSCMAKLMMAESANFPELAGYYMDHVVLRARLLFQSILRRGIEGGEFRALPVAEAARLATVPLVHAASNQHSMLPFDPETLDIQRYLDLHLDIFLRGIATEPETHA